MLPLTLDILMFTYYNLFVGKHCERRFFMASEFNGDKDICFLLKNLDNHIQRYLYSFYKRKDFQDCSLMNMWVSDFLYDNCENEIYQKDIEAEFFINRATASKMLSLMEEKQIIERISSEKDARMKRIALLSKGVALHEQYIQIRAKLERKLTGALSPQEIEQFRILCQKMIAGMGE